MLEHLRAKQLSKVCFNLGCSSAISQWSKQWVEKRGEHSSIGEIDCDRFKPVTRYGKVRKLHRIKSLDLDPVDRARVGQEIGCVRILPLMRPIQIAPFAVLRDCNETITQLSCYSNRPNHNKDEKGCRKISSRFISLKRSFLDIHDSFLKSEPYKAGEVGRADLGVIALALLGVMGDFKLRHDDSLDSVYSQLGADSTVKSAPCAVRDRNEEAIQCQRMNENPVVARFITFRV